MTVPYLKDIVGQAKLYVRPSKDIEVLSEEEPDHEVISRLAMRFSHACTST